ncbi:uncharacterized protein LOC108022406 [Drosophila biarmipes]|uniref:uncharacterized protein LOC108022406 n=1 Tax=Drosophila biarmipes TaxID=125945 RepID=UPI0007E60EF1|nr:uncharacterized protein LOC108022406 [Drosophila biarmipes]
MADGVNFTMAPFPPDAIEYSSTEAEPKSSGAEDPLPSVLVTGLLVLGLIVWLRMISKWVTVKRGLVERNSKKVLEGRKTLSRSQQRIY